MKNNFTRLILLLILFSGCEKSELVQLDLKGTIKGEVYALDEFGFQNSDNENIVIQLEGSEPLISIITDSTGQFEINDIPSGTYNLIILKEGYSVYQIQGVQIVGGNEPLYFTGSIIEKSSTTIESLSIEIVNSSELYLKCIVNHNFIIDQWSYRVPAIRYFIHNLSNPSDINYLQTGTVSFTGDSGTQLEYRIFAATKLFPSGSKIYIKAYGCYGYEYGYYDILSNQYKYSSLGTGSNITSITIP